MRCGFRGFGSQRSFPVIDKTELLTYSFMLFVAKGVNYAMLQFSCSFQCFLLFVSVKLTVVVVVLVCKKVGA